MAQNKGDHAEASKNIGTRLSWIRTAQHLHSALALLDAGDPARNRAPSRSCRRPLRLIPRTRPRILLAQLLERKGDTQGAEQQFQQAISISPKNMEARGALAMLYIRGGDKAKAEQILQQAVQENPEEASASNLLASFYGQAGQLDHAVTVFNDLNT